MYWPTFARERNTSTCGKEGKEEWSHVEEDSKGTARKRRLRGSSLGKVYGKKPFWMEDTRHTTTSTLQRCGDNLRSSRTQNVWWGLAFSFVGFGFLVCKCHGQVVDYIGVVINNHMKCLVGPSPTFFFPPNFSAHNYTNISTPH